MADKVSIDVSALADMRDRLAFVASDAGERSQLEDRVHKAEAELARIVEESQKAEERWQASQKELAEALRLAQESAWESAKELSETESRLGAAQVEVENLREQIRRIVDSRAWKLVSVYRRAKGRTRS